MITRVEIIHYSLRVDTGLKILCRNKEGLPG